MKQIKLPYIAFFYGGAIIIVIALLKTITHYGENYLHPPKAIKNRYIITLAKSLPNCHQVNSLILKVQQSGVYLNAALLPVSADSDRIKQFNLSGILSNQALNLSGSLNYPTICPNLHGSYSPENQIQPVNIRISLASQKTITGEIHFPNAQPISLTVYPDTEKIISPPTQH